MRGRLPPIPAFLGFIRADILLAAFSETIPDATTIFRSMWHDVFKRGLVFFFCSVLCASGCPLWCRAGAKGRPFATT